MLQWQQRKEKKETRRVRLLSLLGICTLMSVVWAFLGNYSSVCLFVSSYCTLCFHCSVSSKVHLPVHKWTPRFFTSSSSLSFLYKTLLTGSLTFCPLSFFGPAASSQTAEAFRGKEGEGVRVGVKRTKQR